MIPNWVSRVGGTDTEAVEIFNRTVGPVAGVKINPDSTASLIEEYKPRISSRHELGKIVQDNSSVAACPALASAKACAVPREWIYLSPAHQAAFSEVVELKDYPAGWPWPFEEAGGISNGPIPKLGEVGRVPGLAPTRKRWKASGGNRQHVFDRGYDSTAWPTGKAPAWHITRGKRSQDHREIWDLNRRQWASWQSGCATPKSTRSCGWWSPVPAGAVLLGT